MHAWLRHPVLGDPSFDTFERLGASVHRSDKPYEWAVNGSLFRDPKDGVWYYYAGLYAYGYQRDINNPTSIIIYRSVDEGRSWMYLGPAFERGFFFEGYEAASDFAPDAVVMYDDETEIYWMSYDWSTNNSNWKTLFHPVGTGSDSGGGLAWAKSPAGPFTRLPVPYISNVALDGHKGRFKRLYANTLLKRGKDWITLVLCDSSDYYSWGLACMTAPSPEGPWSKPEILLSVDRAEYYPAPVEFHPCYVVDGIVYAPATSVAASRNYQAIFTADLEQAHLPEAWSLACDGNVWHSRPIPDETYGIWGQAFHGFVHNGIFHVMYPSKNEQDRGILSVASRPWDRPFADGFTLSGHVGKSISPLLNAYTDFSLHAEFTLQGTVEFVFDYGGVLGPNDNCSDAIPHQQALSAYSALRVSDNQRFSLISIDASGNETLHAEGLSDQVITSIALKRSGHRVTIAVNQTAPMEAEIGPVVAAMPLALVAHEWSNLTCSTFEVEGRPERYLLQYNGWDALLGAGQRAGDWETGPSASFRSGYRLVGQGSCKAKWNVIGDGFQLYAPLSPEYGKVRLLIDGVLTARMDLRAERETASAIVYEASGLPQGRYSVVIQSEDGGKFPIDVLAVCGESAEIRSFGSSDLT